MNKPTINLCSDKLYTHSLKYESHKHNINERYTLSHTFNYTYNKEDVLDIYIKHSEIITMLNRNGERWLLTMESYKDYDGCINDRVVFYPIWFIDSETIVLCYPQSFQFTNDELRKSIQYEIYQFNKELEKDKQELINLPKSINHYENTIKKLTDKLNSIN